MEWSLGENRMLSVLETLVKPKRTIKYYCCCFTEKPAYE